MEQSRDIQQKYVQFPLFLLREIWDNPKRTTGFILDYGLYAYGKRAEKNEARAYKQIVYDYYHDKLSERIRDEIDSYNDCEVFISETNGFNDKGDFDPSEEVQVLQWIAKDNPSFKELVLDHWGHHLARKFYEGSITVKPGFEVRSLENAWGINAKVPHKEPMPMVGIDTLLGLNLGNDSDVHIAPFVAFIALKSVMGKKGYAYTNKKQIVSRMFGYKSYPAAVAAKADKEPLFKKYMTRHHFDKLKHTLELKFNIPCHTPNNRRGYLFGVPKMSLIKLAEIDEKRTINSQKEILKQKKIEARQIAKMRINDTLNKNNTLNKKD